MCVCTYMPEYEVTLQSAKQAAYTYLGMEAKIPAYYCDPSLYYMCIHIYIYIYIHMCMHMYVYVITSICWSIPSLWPPNTGPGAGPWPAPAPGVGQTGRPQHVLCLRKLFNDEPKENHRPRDRSRGRSSRWLGSLARSVTGMGGGSRSAYRDI